MPSLAPTLAPLEAHPRGVFRRPEPLPRDHDAAPGATITRQFSLWPFGTRVLRLFLLCDPTPWDPSVGQALLRAMQQEYFRSEARSQTNALRSSILAAHFSLKARNEDKLVHERLTAAAASAVTRGTTAYVALAGEAAALAWSNGTLSMHRAPVRVARPLGADALPKVVFWSTPLGPDDRLALVCGAAWKDDSAEAAADLLSQPHDAIREHLGLLLAGSDGPARVWIAEGPRSAPTGERVAVPASAPANPPAELDPAAGRSGRVVHALRHPRAGRARRQWLAAAAAVAVVGAAAIGAGRAIDWRSQASPSHANAPAVQPWRVATLGATAADVVDLVAGDGAAYAIDLGGQAVRRFRLADHAADDGSVAVRRGSVVGRGALDTPTAIAWVRDPQGRGQLLVLDRARNAVRVAPSGDVRKIDLPRASEWQSIASVEGGQDALYVLDRVAGRLMAYEGISSSNGPRERDVVTRQAAPALRLDSVQDVVWNGDLYLRYDNGSIIRIDDQGRVKPFAVTPAGHPVGSIAGLARDGSGVLYVLDTLYRSVIQVDQGGQVLRELSLADVPSLDGVRLVRSTGDAPRLVFVDGTDLEALDLSAPGATPQGVGSTS